ncbi:MAG: hypothetical protein K2X79_04240 [Burkholderiaceae bacterium]|nr:hypothetical protein [Burkholderiaceae bacterium]
MEISAFFSQHMDGLVSGLSTVIGAILGALFAILGVIATNKANQKNLRDQLQHDRQTKREEYEHQLRREVYLDLAEAVQVELNLINSLPQIDRLNSDVFARSTSMSGRAARVHLVGNAETLASLAALQNAAAAAIVELSVERNKLISERAGMLTKRQDMEMHKAARDKFLENMASSSVEGTLDSRKEAVLTKHFNFHNELAEKCALEHDRLLVLLQPRLVDFSFRCNERRRELERLIPALVTAVRNELRLDIDHHFYAKLLEGNPPLTREMIEKIHGLPNE